MFEIRRTLLSGRFVVTVVLLVVTNGLAAPLHYRVSDLGLLPGGTTAGPRGLNNHGDVVGSAGDSNGISQPFLYRDGRMTQLTMGISGYALDINDAGHIVGQGVVPPENRYHCFLITPNGTIDLNEQTGLDLWPSRMNQPGQIVGN